jgi:hypothetical protein
MLISFIDFLVLNLFFYFKIFLRTPIYSPGGMPHTFQVLHFKFSISYLLVLPLFFTNDLCKHVQSSLQVRLHELLLSVSRCLSSPRNRISLKLLASNRDSNFGVCLTNSTCHGAPMLHLACQWIDHPLSLGFHD